jgi:SAM-dependent methyltransferase
MKQLFDRLYLITRFKIVTRVLLWRKQIYAALGRNQTQMVNIGAGLFFRPHWKVLDHVSPFYPFTKRYIDHDIDLFTDGPFPFEDASVDFYYSAHTLEHIPQENCANLMSEVYRTLKPGGAFRLCMPDYDRIRAAADAREEAYFRTQLSRGMTFEQAVVEQIATECLDHENADVIAHDYATLDAEEFADRYCRLASRTVQRKMAGYHINWFNFRKLAGMLEVAGFETAYQSTPQGSAFPELRGEGGVLTTGDCFCTKRMLGIDTTHPQISLFVEAVKS